MTSRICKIIILLFLLYACPGISFAEDIVSGDDKEVLGVSQDTSLQKESFSVIKEGEGVEPEPGAKISINMKKAMPNAEQVQPEARGQDTLKEEAVVKTAESEEAEVSARELGLASMPLAPKAATDIYSLNDCINTAIKNHLPLQIAAKSVKLGELRLFEARRNMLPTATIAYEEYSGRIYGRAYIGRKQYVEGQQPVFRGGELYYTMKQAETNLAVVRNDYERIKNELILQVKKAYYTLAKAKENLIVQQEISQEAGRIWSMVIKQSEAGVVSKLEFLNVSSQASQVKYQLASAEGDASVAELVLKQTMNVDMDQRVEIKPNLEFKKVDIDFDKVINAAFLNRAEIKINYLMVDYYNYGKGIARAKGWPKVDLLGSWGLAKEEYAPEDMGPDISGNTDPDRKIEQQWYAGIKTTVPFWGSTAEYSWTKETWVPVVSAFQGTETVTSAYKFKILDKLDYYSERQLSEIDFDRARQELTKVKQDITLEARESCFNYQKALIQLDTASNKVKYQEKDLDMVKLKRGMDEAQDSNVIESMIKLGQEKFGYIQALSDCHISLASVNKAIGVEDYFTQGNELNNN